MLDDINLNEEMIKRKLKKLKNGKAPGIDGIGPKILIESAASLSKPLLMLCKNQCRQERFQLTGNELM
jgi:hypothetical protein